MEESMEYAIYIWSILGASALALICYLKLTAGGREDGNSPNTKGHRPSLFENIQFMKIEKTESLRTLRKSKSRSPTPTPRRTRSQSSLHKKKSRLNSLDNDVNFDSKQNYGITELLNTLGIKSEDKLHLIVNSGFRPMNISQGGVKLNSLINVQESVVVVQSGELKLTIQDGNSFQVSKIVKDGEVIYSKLAVINYMLNFKSRPDDIATIETTRPSVLLVLPLSFLKTLTTEEAVVSSISQFIAEVQKIVIDAFCGELGIPLTTMFKYETNIEEEADVAEFLSQKLDFPDVDFIRKKLVCFELKESGEAVSINGYSHDIGLVLVTHGKLQVHFTEESKESIYYVKNSWYGFVSLLSSPTGTPFPRSYAVDGEPVHGYILTRSTFREMCHQTSNPMKNAAKRLLKSLSPAVFKISYMLSWSTVQGGTKLINAKDPVDSVLAVIRGRLRKQEAIASSQGFLFGVFDCILGRSHRHSVIAARSSQLCFIPSEVIKAIKNRFPTVQNRLVTILGEQLLESWKSNSKFISNVADIETKKNPLKSLKVKSMALFGASPTPDMQLSRFAAELASGISMLSVQVKRISSRKIQDQLPDYDLSESLDPLSNPHLLEWLRDQERAFQVLIYQCDPTMTPWTKWCLSEADVVLDCCLASKGPFVSVLENQVFQYTGLHCDICLVILHSPQTVLPRGTADWLYRRKSYLDTHYHVKLNYSEPLTLHSDIARVGRHVLGLDVGLVLGGGGARGAAHVGMIKAIQEVGIPIDRLGGVSIGSLIGALWAVHRDFEKMKKLAEEWFEMIHYDYLGHASNLTYPYISVFTGDYFNTTVKRTLGETIMIEDLWLPYYCCTTDISDLNSRQHNDGWLWRYVRASMTYSSVLPPICDPRDGHLLVDGCYSENVPGRAMKKTGVKYLLALDIATMDERNLTNYGDSLSGTWAWFDRAKPFGKQKLKIPDSVEIQLRLAFCSHYRNLEELQNDPDFEYLCPDLGKFTSSDFGNFKEIYELGYNYATTYLAGMRKLK